MTFKIHAHCDTLISVVLEFQYIQMTYQQGLEKNRCINIVAAEIFIVIEKEQTIIYCINCKWILQ